MVIGDGSWDDVINFGTAKGKKMDNNSFYTASTCSATKENVDYFNRINRELSVMVIRRKCEYCRSITSDIERFTCHKCGAPLPDA